MEFIILGKTNDDKGTQLEKLTASLLTEQGYTDVYTNVVNAGASEVDIKATYRLPFMSGNVTHEVIGECKAYARAVSLPDWLKFLGKIFSEEIAGSQIQACFIAVSGVNSNVVGHYNSIKTKRKDILLLAGDDLNALLFKYYDVKIIGDIQAIIQTLTNEQPINYSICYYDSKFYWCVSFADNNYTLLKGDGKTLSKSQVTELHEMIIKTTDLLTFVDLHEKKMVSERTETTYKYIINSLLIENQFLTDKEILNKVNEYFGEGIQNLKISEINASLKVLGELGLILKSSRKYNLVLFSDRATLQDVLTFYQYFTHKSVVLKGLMSQHYGTKINEEVLDYIIITQGNIQLSKEKYAECLQLIRWSPSALAWGLTPDPNIVNHRSNGAALAPKLEHHDTNYFVRKMYNLFSQEFNNHWMSSYFFSLGLRDLDLVSTIKISSEDGIEISNQSHEKIGLVRLTEEYGNQIIPVNLLENESLSSNIDPSEIIEQ